MHMFTLIKEFLCICVRYQLIGNCLKCKKQEKNPGKRNCVALWRNHNLLWH